MSARLDDILDKLKVEYGKEGTSVKHGTTYYAIDKKERKSILAILIQTLKDNEWTLERLSTNEFRVAVATWCFPDALTDTWPNKKRVSAYASATQDLRTVVAQLFDETKLSKAPEPSPTQSRVEGQNEYNPSIHKSFAKELDRSVLAEAPKPNTGVNEEMAEFLGLKK